MSITTHLLIRGDTLISIANSYGISNWRILAEVNNLDFPFIVEDKSVYTDRNVLQYGDYLLISSSADSSIDELPYGSDLKLVFSDSVSVFDTTGNLISFSGDLQVVTQTLNVVQAIMNRLVTTKGELPLHPDYGCNLKTILGRGATETNLIKAKLEVINTCNEDFRVKGTEVKLFYSNGVLSLDLTITTIFGTQAKASLALAA